MESRNFEEFALGEGTSSYFARYQGYPIHLDHLNKARIDSLILGWQTRGRKEVILMLGNSQMHGINQYQQGQVSYNQMLFDSLRHSYDLIAQSVPNANLQEFLFTYQFWKQKLPVTKLIVPVFFDDLREDGIRFIGQNEHSVTAVVDLNDASAREWNKMITRAAVMTSPQDEQAALANTVQSSVEAWLASSLAGISDAWAQRPQMRGLLFTNLYTLRNRVFGIHPQSVRRVIPVRYKKNFAALDLLARVTLSDNVPLMLYIPPIRSDVKTPYDPVEYQSFKQDLSEWKSKYGHVSLENFENAIEGKYWGLKQNTAMRGELEYDFMHFSYDGHKALAGQLMLLIAHVKK